MQYLPPTSGSLSAVPVTIWFGGPIGASFKELFITQMTTSRHRHDENNEYKQDMTIQ